MASYITLLAILAIINLISCQQQSNKQQLFYLGSSNACDQHMRLDFLAALLNQFERQKSDDPIASKENSDILKWKFNNIDKNLDGRLNDREWSKFKNSFKLVDDVVATKQAGHTLILRKQRKCWRDFLEFCGGEEILIDELIDIEKWQNCTKHPNEGLLGHSTNIGKSSRSQSSATPSVHAFSKDAALARSKSKNPFEPILKFD